MDAPKNEDWVVRALVHVWSMRLALIAVALSFVLPVQGLGIDLCWFHRMTGLPCPGCGLTRSLTSVAHLDFGHAFLMHPFGPLIWALALALAIGNFVGEERRERVRRWLRQRVSGARRAYLAFIVAFVTFGVARVAIYLAARFTA